MTIYEVLEQLGYPVAYFQFEEPPTIPFLVYRGSGSSTFLADESIYHSENTYEVMYYFTNKNTDIETAIEKHLTSNGFKWEKGEDVYIEQEEMYRISYYI